jgi:hypothetical protein
MQLRRAQAIYAPLRCRHLSQPGAANAGTFCTERAGNGRLIALQMRYTMCMLAKNGGNTLASLGID